MAVKYVKRKDGKFDGSQSTAIGKRNIPDIAGFRPDPVIVESKDNDGHRVDEAWEAFQSFRDGSSGSIDVTSFGIDDSFPVPQANSLAKVAATVDAIEDGADTDDAVAIAIGVTPRQGAYYANAAGYLGLVTPTGSTSPRQWALTAAGAQFLNSDASTRTAILEHIVSTIPEVDASLNDGADVDELLAERLGENTAVRRAATIDAWLTTLTNASDAETALTLETDGVRERISEAKEVAIQAKAEARRRAKIERPSAICPSCSVALPATGICDDCD